jgi:hypothetical protein
MVNNLEFVWPVRTSNVNKANVDKENDRSKVFMED